MAAKTTVKVALTNNAAKDDVFSLGESQTDSWSLDVLANDPGSATLWSVGVPATTTSGGQMAQVLGADFSYTGPTNGTGHMEIKDGKISFDLGGYDSDKLAAGERIIFTVQYTAKMANGVLSTASVTVTIDGSNDGPVAHADLAVTGENNIILINALANDTDADNGAQLSLISASAPSGKGSASIVGDKVQFNPGSAFDHLPVGGHEDVIITYTMTDEHGAQSTNSITVTVTGTNDGPVAVADSATTSENASVLIDALANDTDADDGAQLSLVSASAPSGKGSASIVDGKVQFDPGTAFDHLPAGESENVTLSYIVKDEHGAESIGSITVTITGTNDAAVISGETTGTLTESNQASSTGGTLQVQDLDDGQSHFVAQNDAQGQFGSFAIDQQGVWTYTMDGAHNEFKGGQNYIDSFQVTTADGTSDTVMVTIHGTNDAPSGSATALLANGAEDNAYIVSVAELLQGFGDAEGDSLAVANLSASNGTVTANGNGTYTIASTANYNGPVTLTYNVTDGNGGTTPATIGYSLNPVNDAPANASGVLAGAVTEDGALTASGDVNATDLDGDTLTYAVNGSTTGTYGSLAINAATGQWTYTLANASSAVQSLNTGDIRSDSFTISITDGHGGTASQTVSVTINGANEPVTTPTLAPVVDSGDPNNNDPFGNSTSTSFNGDNSANDTLYGGAGNDTISGNGGNDVIYGGSGNDNINGNNDNDTLYGGDGIDNLSGNNGIDTLIGGYGGDTLTGNNENDVFKFLSVNDRGDTITDFAGDPEKIDISAIDANGALVNDQAFAWGGTTATANGVWYSPDALGDLHVYADTDGNTATAEFWFTVTGSVSSLSANDFVL